MSQQVLQIEFVLFIKDLTVKNEVSILHLSAEEQKKNNKTDTSVFIDKNKFSELQILNVVFISRALLTIL